MSRRLVRFPAMMAAFLVAISAFIPIAAFAQQSEIMRQPKVEIDLISETQAVRPGDEVTIALRQRITPGWHTYWTNPGDSGEPTRIDWQLPPGASAGPIQWPLPHAIPVGPLTNFGYSDELLLLTDIKVPENARGDRFHIQADAKWLVCEEICIPEEASADLSLPLVDPSVSPLPSSNASLIAETRKTIPEPKPWPAQFDIEGDGLALKVSKADGAFDPNAEFHFFPLKWGLISHSAPQQASLSDGALTMQLQRGDFADGKQPEALNGVLAVETRGADGETVRQGYSISAAPADLPVTPSASPAPVSGGPGTSGGGISLLVALGFSFLGGLILNLMPCVFPVLSLKALSLAKDAGNAEARRTKGLVYLAGVLVSFAAIGLALVALRSGGAAIGWGMQFQSPAFVLAMMALFLGLGLNLSGVFTVGNNVTGLGDSLTQRSGMTGYFFTGVLATVVATPCTAPFMGAAMGYAFTQPATVVFAVLLTLGFGFALPILLLSLTPTLGRWLPKPGAWMETFKQVMAFPLYATVGWLLWVLSIQLGSDGVLAGILTLLGVGFAAWLFGRSMNAGLARGAAAMLIAVLAVGAGVWSLAGTSYEPVQANAGGGETVGPASEPFTRARLDELLGQNKPVFVNLTAAWCITCKVNERVALRSERFANALLDRDITYLVGDWTNGNPEITSLLKAHGRVGVPLYLLYSGSPGAEPEILPQLLTETIVLNRLQDLPSQVKQAKGEL